MNPDRPGELLTAYLDGELSARERQAVERLLEQSPKARAQLQQLQEGANVLRSLPRHRPHRDLAEPVLHAIAERRLHPGRRRSFGGEVGVPSWLGVGVAAAVILLVSVAGLVYISLAGQRREHRDMAAATHSGPAGMAKQKFRDSQLPMPSLPPPPVKEDQQEPSHPAPPAPVRDHDTETVRKSPPPPPKHLNNQLASPPAPESKLEVFGNKDRPALLKLPLHLAGGHPGLDLLRAELQRAGACRVELACLGKGKGVERVQKRLRAQGVQLFVDPLVSQRLGQAMRKTDFVIYSESLTVRDLGKLLEQLGAEEDRAAKKRDAQFGNVVVNRYREEDRLNLSSLLGVDPGQLPSPTKAPLGVDIRKSLEDSTADNLTNMLAGKGTPRPGTAPAKGQAAKTAIVLPFNPVHAQPEHSKAIRQFLESRKQHPAATVPVLLILRGANS